MTPKPNGLSTDEKRALLRERLASGRKLPRTYPASYSQRRLWFMHKLAPDSPAYNVEAALQLGPVDESVLERAINGVVARHGSLRTTFLEVDGEPMQKVADSLHVPLEVVDLTALSPTRRDTRLAALRKDCATQAFDLLRGPLVRTHLVRLTRSRSLLLLNLHHILADGWSMGIFTRDLTVLFEAFSKDVPSPLPPLPLQYGDYAAWQRRAGDGEGFAEEMAWWTESLSGMAPLDLPTDRPRPAVQSYRGAFHNATFPRQLTERLEDFSRRQGVTLFMTLLTGFKALLARLAHTEDVAVGTYIANRERTEIEGLIGFFLNTLVLRTRLPEAASFRDALSAVRETALGAYANQALPFEKLVEVLKPPRDLGRNPLVQVVLQLQNATEDASGEGSALIDYQRSAAAFDLAVTAYIQGGRLHFTYEYATDLFDAETVARLATRLEQVLAQAVAAPDTALADLDILLPEEVPSFGEAAEFAVPVTGLFAASAAKQPDAPAFFVGEACATIGQVALCAERIATALYEAGIGKGDVVGVCLPRSVELAASLMGIWQAGAVYLPLDPAYPAARLRFMAEDSGARLVLVQAGTGEELPENIPKVNVNRAIGDLSQPAPGFAPVILSPEDPSHIIYTSGSTGRPKGAVSPHRQVLNRFDWMWRRLPHGPDEVEVMKTATSFIDSIWELAGPMIALRPSSIVDAQTLLEPKRLIAQLARDGVTRMWTTPSYLRLLLDSHPDPGAAIPQLTTWFITGEKLSARLASRFRDAMPGARLLNLYGTSEAWDICCHLDGADEPPVDPVPVGTPLDNVDVLVLDAKARPVPHGVPGELFIGGAAPCLGFVNRDDLAEERMIAYPSDRGEPVRLLASGDRARCRRDGRIEILGRVDDELKIAGMRVHPAEVEALLSQVDGVTAAAVAGVPGPDDGTRLWAWVTTRGDAGVTDPAALRAELALALPAHMVPERISHVAQMPQTPSGKIDRASLIRQTAEPPPPDIRVETDAEASDIAKRIAEVFAEVLGRPVGVREHFFSAGGHSLLAARALARINDRLSLDLRIRDFFLDPTAAGLATRAAAGGNRPGARQIRRLARGPGTAGAAAEGAR